MYAFIGVTCTILLFCGIAVAVAAVSKEKKENELNRARGDAMNVTSKINHDYALGLTELDLLDIAYAERPYDLIAERVSPGYPSVAEFLSETNRMILLLSDEMDLSDHQRASVALSFSRELVPSVTIEAVQSIADNFSAYVPDELYFLKNKINYELSTLGIIMTVAQQTSDYDLQHKVQALRKKRGYI